MRRPILIVLMLASSARLIAAPSPVVQPPAPVSAAQVAKPDAATIAEAVRFLDAQGFDESAIRSTDLMIGVSLAAMVEQLQKRYGDTLASDFVEQLRTTIHDHAMATMRAHLAEMKREAAEIYALEFTRSELIHLRELNADPVAVKARERGQIMQPKLMKIGAQTMRAAQPELEAKINRMVSDYLAAHGKAAAPSS